MRLSFVCGLTAAMVWPASALAWEPQPESETSLELALDIGMLDRGTTGVGDPLLDLGYDHGGGPQAGFGLRAYFEINEYFRHGPNLRISHQGAFGLTDTYGFAWTQLDLTYVFRTSLPCMSDDEMQWYLSGLIGLTGVHAEAGTGDAPRDDRWNERLAASESLDHLALGGVIGAGIDLHLDEWFIGLMLDVREPFALGETPVSRSFVTSATMRAGVELAL